SSRASSCRTARSRSKLSGKLLGGGMCQFTPRDGPSETRQGGNGGNGVSRKVQDLYLRHARNGPAAVEPTNSKRLFPAANRRRTDQSRQIGRASCRERL